MTLALEEAILRLKAEIIAQDWRLSPSRAEQLEAAFASLRQHFAARKPIHAMLVMAANVLAYIKNRGASPPETIDFLKEAMAHVVNLHEDLSDDPEGEETLFRGLYSRFSTLKSKIQHRSGSNPQAVAPPTPPSAVLEEPAGSANQDLAPARSEPDAIARHSQDFLSTLNNAGPIGARIAPLFAAWLDSPAVSALLRGTQEPSPLAEESPCPPPGNAISACQPTPVTALAIGGITVAIPTNAIAMVRPLAPSVAGIYLQNASVPLKDFAKFLQRLAQQFRGSLAQVDERTLLGLSLPVMIPQGHDLPETPPPSSNLLIILSSGNRHGAILCEAAANAEQTMVQFAKQHNGDIAGTASLDDGDTIPLLDPFAILQREGILLIRE